MTGRNSEFKTGGLKWQNFSKCYNEKVNIWIEEQIALCRPANVVWINGDEAQLEALQQQRLFQPEK